MARRGRRRADGRTVGYAVVGLGHVAQVAVLPAFRHATENSRLVALVSGEPRKRRELGERHGVPAYRYEDLDEVLARDDVDAVYVALPNTLHAECAVRAARAGVHVLTEKPMATSEEDADVRIIEAALRSAREHVPVALAPLHRRRRPSAGQVRHRPAVKAPEPLSADSPDQ